MWNGITFAICDGSRSLENQTLTPSRKCLRKTGFERGLGWVRAEEGNPDKACGLGKGFQLPRDVVSFLIDCSKKMPRHGGRILFDVFAPQSSFPDDLRG